MTSQFFCGHCNEEFVSEEVGGPARCPRCMRRGSVEPVPDLASGRAKRRRWPLVATVLVLAVGAGYAFYRSTTISLEETPPLRPLDPAELAAYLERDQIRVGPYDSMMMLSGKPGSWPATIPELAAAMHSRSASWSLVQPLPREVLTADQTLGRMEGSETPPRFYPLELATAMTVLLRKRGVNAMVAEVWEIDQMGAPPDPSGTLGYFVTAVYPPNDGEESSVYFDPWGGRTDLKVKSVRVLRDTEVLAAALEIEAIRIFSASGDSAKALPMVETALLLDPRSPTLRSVNAKILVESGGLTQAISEFEAAAQLRPDGPRQLDLVKLHLAQAGILQMRGEQEGAEAQFGEAQHIVTEVIERWPRFGRAHVALATVYLGVDEPERARVELEAAEDLDPNLPVLWAVWAQYHLTQSDSMAAAAAMQRAVRLDPDDWQLRLQAARVLQGAGEDRAAEENLAAAMKMVPPEKRAEVRRFIEQMMGSRSPTATPKPQQAAPDDPALMLGDPSKLRLRDPNQTLKLNLDP